MFFHLLNSQMVGPEAKKNKANDFLGLYLLLFWLVILVASSLYFYAEQQNRTSIFLSSLVALAFITLCFLSLIFYRSKQNLVLLAERSEKVEHQMELLHQFIVETRGRLDQVQKQLGLEIQTLPQESILTVAILRRIMIGLEDRLGTLVELHSTGNLEDFDEAERLINCKIELLSDAAHQTVGSSTLPPLEAMKWKPTVLVLLAQLELEVAKVMDTVHNARARG